MVSLLWVPLLGGSGKDLQLCPPRAPVAHWAMRAMNMQCLSPNTQVRWKQRPLEQLQLPGVGWGGVCAQVFTQCLVPGLGLANFMATLSLAP